MYRVGSVNVSEANGILLNRPLNLIEMLTPVKRAVKSPMTFLGECLCDVCGMGCYHAIKRLGSSNGLIERFAGRHSAPTLEPSIVHGGRLRAMPPVTGNVVTQ
jgi:hypothetical protein